MAKHEKTNKPSQIFLLSVKFKFYTLLSPKFELYTLFMQSLKFRVFTQLSGYEYYNTSILYLFAFSFRSMKEISLVSFRACAQRDSKFRQETTLKKMLCVHAR